MNSREKESGFALIPFAAFVVIYVFAGIYYQAKGVDMPFYQFPSATALFIALILAFIMTRRPVSETFAVFAEGAGNVDVLTMLCIYAIAGAFSNVCSTIGAMDDVVNLGLSLVPPQFLAAGIFIICAFMGTATGSSSGTLTALVPIAASIAEASGLSVPLTLGACVGGAMFGDNLSMISDTTIAATRTQHCGMRDKFRMNFLIALPAALVTIVLLLIFGRPQTIVEVSASSFSLVNILPYILVLVLALSGMDVFVTLVIGLGAAIVIGFCRGILGIPAAAQAVWAGIVGMDESFYVTFMVAGLAQIVSYNGGINWIIGKVRKIMKNRQSAELGIGALITGVDVCLANNTVAILLCGPVARQISEKYGIDPRKTASILDTFSCTFQGMLPWMAQALITINLANSVLTHTAVYQTQLLATSWYCWLLLAFAVFDIFVPYADGVVKKDPWDREFDCPESSVEREREKNED